MTFKPTIDLSGNKVIADEFVGAVDSDASIEEAIANKTEIAALTAVGAGGLDATLSTSDTYTDAAVKAAIDGSLDLVQAKLDAIIAALKA